MEFKKIRRAPKAQSEVKPKKADHLYLIPGGGMNGFDAYFPTLEEAVQATTPKNPDIYKLAHHVTFNKVVEDVGDE